jgi:pilus assembly protein Flp/PilA
MESIITRFVHEDQAATAVEYGLMVALIAAVIVAFVTQLGKNVNAAFKTVCDSIATAGSGTAC